MTQKEDENRPEISAGFQLGIRMKDAISQPKKLAQFSSTGDILHSCN